MVQFLEVLYKWSQLYIWLFLIVLNYNITVN